LSARSDEIVREVANHVASHPDGFWVSKDGSSVPNDQATTHRLIPVIHATLAMRPPTLARDNPDLHRADLVDVASCGSCSRGLIGLTPDVTSVAVVRHGGGPARLTDSHP
jgi:hypothetical protein